MTVSALLRVVLAAVLVGAAAAKLARGGESRLALRSFGLRGARVRAVAWAALVGVEVALGGAVAASLPGASELAAVLLLGFGVVLLAALARGHGGRPCGCFGSRSRIGWFSVLRAFLLALGFALLPTLAHVRASTQAWLVAGLAVALAGVAAGGVGLLALARELGELRLAVGPQAALAIDGEGPELGQRFDLIDRFDTDTELALAVFTSPACRLCEALEPALRLVESEPGVAVERFDEHADAEHWSALAVPGSPYGVVLDADGVALSKGTFNTLAQLEGLLAVAERRRAGVLVV